MYFSAILNVIIFLIASFVLWIFFVRKRIFSNNDFWDFILLLLIFSVIGYYIFSYVGILIANFVATLIFFKLKTYLYNDIFDFFVIFTAIILIPSFILLGYIYLLILILVISLILYLRYLNINYGISIFLLIYSIIYFNNKKMWIFSHNYIYNYDMDAIFFLISILFVFLNIFFKANKNTYKNILKRKA